MTIKALWYRLLNAVWCVLSFISLVAWKARVEDAEVFHIMVWVFLGLAVITQIFGAMVEHREATDEG